jgi:hypothetical protein
MMMTTDNLVDIVQSAALITICITLIVAVAALIRAVQYGVASVRQSNQEILNRLGHVEKLLDDDIARDVSAALSRPPPGPPH